MTKTHRYHTFGNNIMETYFMKEWENAWIKYVTNQMQNDGFNITTNPHINYIDFSAVKSCGSTLHFNHSYDFVIQNPTKILAENIVNNTCVKLLEKYKIMSWNVHCHLRKQKITIQISYNCTVKHIVERDVFQYTDRCTQQTMMVFMHEQQCEWTANSDVERYFADDYLLHRLFQYLCVFYD